MDSVFDQSKEWTHYLTRPFTLFGASMWQEWYTSQETLDIFGAQMKDALFVEQAPGLARNYRVRAELERFKQAARATCEDAAQAKQLLQEGAVMNDEAREYISGARVFGSLEDAVRFLVALALRATVLPYWVVACSENIAYRDGSILPRAEKLRAVSLYPDLVTRVITPLARQRSGLETEYLTLHEILVGDTASAQERASASRAGGFFVYQVLGEQETVSFTQNPGALIAAIERSDDAGEIRGQVAFPGTVRGIARIIYSLDAVREFNEGDILVSINSNPSLMPLIKKCGGIVTDEGGIMCHAAIVARELKKPCVIGTRVATQVLKDGMMIEVDGEKGVIRIIT